MGTSAARPQMTHPLPERRVGACNGTKQAARLVQCCTAATSRRAVSAARAASCPCVQQERALPLLHQCQGKLETLHGKGIQEHQMYQEGDE